MTSQPPVSYETVTAPPVRRPPEMSAITEVEVSPLDPARFREALGDAFVHYEEGLAQASGLFDERAVWHVNSTARGGGVAELLQSLLAYARGAGVDARWIVIGGNPEFFEITKRIHNRLHGADGDGGELGDEAREIYERTLAASTEELVARVRPGDIVFLHDPQTAGMAAALRERGTIVVWRCHVGLDVPNDVARSAWDFLRPYVEPADAFVFSRRSFVWDGIDEDRTWLVAPSIDAFSPKNQELPDTAVRAILRTIGLGDGEEPTAAGRFTRVDGTPGRVDRAAELHQDGLIPTDATLITQVSRWDSLKDPIGVLRGFTSALADRPEAHLLLAGPSVAAVADDPEGAGVLADVIAERERLPAEERARVHLACLPMDDIQENAAMVNAIQRRSDIVVQKSFAEGFGLTVAEAMWKSRPVVASARGGIQDQITDRESGLLVQDPTDLEEFGAILAELVADPGMRERIGAAAHDRVRDEFLGSRHLLQYEQLLADLLELSEREA